MDAIITATSWSTPLRRFRHAGVTGQPGGERRATVPCQRQCAVRSDDYGLGRRRGFHLGLGPGLGPLPPGIILNGSTTAVTSISGTPTATGSYSFTLQATDALSRVATQTISMVVNAEDTCLLIGRFSFIVTGFRGGGPATHARRHQRRRVRQY